MTTRADSQLHCRTPVIGYSDQWGTDGPGGGSGDGGSGGSGGSEGDGEGSRLPFATILLAILLLGMQFQPEPFGLHL